MRRRKTLWTVGILFLLAGGTLATLAVLVGHEPEFYRQKEIAAGKLRSDLSKEFESILWPFLARINDENDFWQATFTEAQINSYFQERFIPSGLAGTMLPKNVSDPRISIEDDTIRLGFRYGQGFWSTVINIDLRVWMAPKESNVVAIELLGLRAGLLPISGKYLMEQITRGIQGQNRDIEVSWYRHEGNMVALLRFSASRARVNNQLEQLKVGQGKIVIAGRSLNALPPAGEVPPGIGPPSAKGMFKGTLQQPTVQATPASMTKEPATPAVKPPETPTLPPVPKPKETVPAKIDTPSAGDKGNTITLPPPIPAAPPPPEPPALPKITVAPPSGSGSASTPIVPAAAPSPPPPVPAPSVSPGLPPVPRFEDVPPPPVPGKK